MISDDDLASQPFVARGYLHHQDLKRIGHREPKAMVEMMEAQLMLILSGAYIGYLPAHYAEAWVLRGELRAIQNERRSYDSTFYFVTQRGSIEDPLIRDLHSALLRSTSQSEPTAGLQS